MNPIGRDRRRTLGGREVILAGGAS
jgi:hypothetical protein